MPATVVPDFAPGVRIRLTDDVVAADRISLAALVAGDDARRNAGRAHQECESTAVVFAETASRVEQEFVNAVAAERRWPQGIDEVLGADHVQRGSDNRRVAARSEEHTSELQSLMRISYAVF